MEITPLVLTFNEEANLAATLAQLQWAREIVVVDSHSTDRTLSIAASYDTVRVVRRTFDSHNAQWTAGIAECQSLWVLALDADYVLSRELVEELRQWRPAPDVDAYFCRFRYCINGQVLRGSLYPPRAVLFRKDRCRYVQDGHTQVLEVKGAVGWLENVIYHDDRKSISRWLTDQERYARLEADKLTRADPRSLSLPDRLRKKVLIAPLAVLVHVLFWNGVILDGWPGVVYACQRVLAELILSLCLAQGRSRLAVNAASETRR